MKNQMFKKKLALNKKTVANLSNEELQMIKGGTDFSDNCPSDGCMSVLICPGTYPRTACNTSDYC